MSQGQEEKDAAPKPKFKKVLDSKNVTLFQGDMKHASELNLKPDVVIMDPPYSDRVQSKSKKGLRGQRNISSTREFPWPPLSSAQIKKAVEVAKETRRFIVIFCDDTSSILWRKAMSAAGIVHVRQCLWLKRGAAPEFHGDRPAQHHELIEVFHNPTTPIQWNGHGRGNVYVASVIKTETNENHGALRHPATKPISLMKELVSDFSNPGELIVDLFSGIGKTLGAAEQLGRKCIGIEKNPRYIKRTLKELKQCPLEFEYEDTFSVNFADIEPTPHGHHMLRLAWSGLRTTSFVDAAAKRLEKLTGHNCVTAEDKYGFRRMVVDFDMPEDVRQETERILVEWSNISKHILSQDVTYNKTTKSMESFISPQLELA